MNDEQFSVIIQEMARIPEEALQYQLQNQELYDPRAVIKMTLNCSRRQTKNLIPEMIELIELFLVRGPKISRITERNTREVSLNRINFLKKKYKLQDFASGEEVLNGEALSLRKLISAFPYQLLYLLKSKEYKRPLGKNVLQEAGASNFPGFLKNSTFLSIIPLPNNNSRIPLFANLQGIKRFNTVVQGVIAYEFLESFIVHKWATNFPLTPNKGLSNAISVAQNTLNSNFIIQKIREENFIEYFQEDLIQNLKDVENLISYTNTKYPGFKETLSSHFSYDLKNKKFECKSRIFCRHVER